MKRSTVQYALNLLGKDPRSWTALQWHVVNDDDDDAGLLNVIKRDCQV